MTLATLRSDIAKLRRDQPRNPTSAAVCDGAEEALAIALRAAMPPNPKTAPIVKPTALMAVIDCPVCADRRVAKAKTMRRYRGKAK